MKYRQGKNPKSRNGFKKGHKYLRKPGYKHSELTKKKIGLSQRGIPRPYQEGENHGEWRGEKASYTAYHKWVAYWRGTPKLCEMCGRDDDKGTYDWANIDHQYRRVLNDYIRLCRKCHKNFDKEKAFK